MTTRSPGNAQRSPKVRKVHIETVEAWLKDNAFEESYAHGVRNPVTNRPLLSRIN